MGGAGGEGGMGGAGGMGGEGGMGGAGGEGGMGGAGGAMVPDDCAGYCEIMAANCADTYADEAACLAACAEFPTDGAVGDAGGNTLQCRIYHAGVAGMMDPVVHCPHAGPDGAEVCVDAPPPMNMEPDSQEAPFRLEFDGDRAAALFELAPAGDVDWFIFTLAEPALVEIATQAPGDAGECNGDTIIELIPAPDGDRIARDDDRPGSLCSLIGPGEIGGGLPAGDYLIRANAFGDGAAGINELSVTLLPTIPVGEPCGANDVCDFGSYCAAPAEGADQGLCTAHACGDAVVAPDEACDDGNMDAGDGCEACAIVGIPVGNPCEVGLGALPCEDAAFCDDRGEAPVCAPIACGDGVVNGDEACDDGNMDGGDGCEACAIVGIPAGNACDPAGFPCAFGSFCDASGEAPVCAANVCGDEIRGNSEECDDGNADAGDGCDADCMVESDAARYPEPDAPDAPFRLEFDAAGHAEALYQNNPADDTDWFIFTVPGDAEATVYTHAWDDVDGCIGDTIIELFQDGESIERNDDFGLGRCSRIETTLSAGDYLIHATSFLGRVAGPNLMNVDLVTLIPVDGACNPEDAAARCADGLECFEGACVAPVCGDGIVGPGEACDDGNDDDADGCTAACEIGAIAAGYGCDPLDLGFEADCEDGTYCPQLGANKGEIVVCTAHVCGDGVVGPEEACDDANADDTDGCTAECAFGPDNNAAEPDSLDMPTLLDLAGGRALIAFEINPADDEDFFAFQLDAPARMRIRTGTLAGGCAGDTFLELWAAGAEAPLVTDDDNGPGTCSDINALDDAAVNPLAAGDYVIKVRPFSPRLIGQQFLWVEIIPTLAEGDACDADDRFSACPEATFCNDAGVCAAHVCGDLVVGPDEACDDGNEMNGDGCEACQFAAIADGMACPVAGTDCGEASYCADGICTAHACGDGVVGPDEECDGGENCAENCTFLSQLIEGPGAFEGGFPEDGSDVYTFSLDAPAQVLAFTGDGEGGCPGDTVLTLFDADANEQIARNDDNAAIRPCSQIEEILAAGNYRIEVSGFSGGAIEAYTLGVAFTPVLGDNEICDRSGTENVCAAGLTCAIVDGDGLGLCAPLAGAADEVEPNDTGADALANNRVTPNAEIASALDGDQDTWDVFAVQLDGPGRLTVSTPDCTADTRLYRIDPAVLDADGIDAAVDAANRFAYNDDSAGLCSQLSADLDAGVHYFLVDTWGRNDVMTYTFSATLVGAAPAGALCDVEGVQVQCADGLSCFDDNFDNDGQCAAFMAAAAGENPSMGFGDGGFDLWTFTIDAPQRVTLSTAPDADSCNDDTYIALYRVTADGPDLLTANDDAGGLGLCSRISEVLMPGDYIVRVNGFGGGAVGEYSFGWMGPAMIAEGEACDRAGIEDRCMDGLGCMPGMDPGVGVCMMTWMAADEVEPDETSADAAALAIVGTTRVAASLVDGDDYDIFVVELAGPARVRAATGDGMGGCPDDTRMYRVDPMTLDANDAATAVANAFSEDDDGGVGRCSQLTETLDAGMHFYAVRHYTLGNDIAAYAFDAQITPILGDGDPCDAMEMFNLCGDGLSCVDDNADNDGQCMAPMVP